MIYLASYEPGGSLYNREREHILGREPAELWSYEGIWTDLGGRAGSRFKTAP